MAKRVARRRSTAPSADNDLKAMELIQKSGILNKSATLENILALSMTLSGPSFAERGARSAARWVFISRHYVYKGDQRT
jgi:hypothetical protein